MKEKFKNDCPMLVGFIVAMCIIDLFSNDFFDLLNMLLRIIVTVVVYVLFRFIECKKKRD